MAILDSASFDPLSASGILSMGAPAGNFQNNARSRIADILMRMGMGFNRAMAPFPDQLGQPATSYQPQNMPSSVAGLVLGATGNAGIPPPLPAPVNIGNAPQPMNMDAGLPPNATPTGPAMPSPQLPPQLQQPQPQVPQAGGIGSFLSGLGNHLATGLSAMNPQAGNALFQRQLLNAQLQSLAQVPGMTTAKAIAIVSNPEVSKAYFGNPTPVGELKVGDISLPATAQGGNVSYPTPGGGTGGGPDIGNLLQLNNQITQQKAAATKLGEAQGAAQGNEQNALAQYDQTLKAISELKNDPHLAEVVGGPVIGRNPGLTGPQNATIARIKQIAGQMVVNAIQANRGAGVRLTQQEINQIQAGQARLERTQDLPSFQKALGDLQSTMAGLRTRVGITAGGAPTPPQQQQQAAPSGGVVDYRHYFGIGNQ